MIPVGFISTINALVAAANNKLGVWEILLIIACAAIVISFVVVSIVRKKKGQAEYRLRRLLRTLQRLLPQARS